MPVGPDQTEFSESLNPYWQEVFDQLCEAVDKVLPTARTGGYQSREKWVSASEIGQPNFSLVEKLLPHFKRAYCGPDMWEKVEIGVRMTGGLDSEGDPNSVRFLIFTAPTIH